SNIATPQPEPTPDRTRVRPGQTRQKPCSSNHVPGGATRYNSRPDQKRRANPNPTPTTRAPPHDHCPHSRAAVFISVGARPATDLTEQKGGRAAESEPFSGVTVRA